MLKSHDHRLIELMMYTVAIHQHNKPTAPISFLTTKPLCYKLYNYTNQETS